MEIRQTPSNAVRDWAGLLFRPLLISAMVTCIAAAWVWIIESVIEGWHGTYLIWIVGIVTLEALLVERQLRRRRLALLEPRTWQIRLAEIGIMLFFIKVGSYLSSGWEGLARDVAEWIAAPESFFNFEFVVGMLIVGALWGLSASIAGNLAEIEDENNLPGEPEAARDRLQDDFMIGAFFLLVAVGAQRLSISPAGLGLRPVQLGGLTILPLVYVGLGMLLLGQVRLSLLLARWQRQDVPVSSGIERRWAGWSIVFVAAILLIALVLPAGETSLGVYLLTIIALVMLFIGQILGFIFYLLLSLLFLPFGALRTTSSVPPTLPQLPTFPSADETLVAPGWLFSVRTILLAALVLLIALFILNTYWRDRRASGLWQALWDILCGAWNGIRAWLGGSKRRVEEMLKRTRTTRGRETAPISLSWWRAWRAHSSRERVRRLYLALLERAARVGHARRPAQTPFEYSTDLEPHLQDTEGLATLTHAFVQARYSRNDFTPTQVSRLHRLWQRLQDELRRL